MNKDDTNTEARIGMVNFSLSKIENQQEYDVLLEIHDEEYENIIKAKINAKIKFTWSFYLLYQELHSISEKKLENLQISLQNIRQLLENLNGIIILYRTFLNNGR